MEEITRPKVHFITFGTYPKYKNALDHLCKEAIESGYFDTISVYNQTHLNLNKEIFEIFIRTRGFGFWVWKPLIINSMINNLPIGDILIYADAGCGISVTPEAKDTYKYIIDMIINHPTHRIGLQMPHIEDKYTKEDIFQYLECTGNEYRETGQYAATIQFYQVTEDNRKFIKEWLDKCLADNLHFISDNPTRIPSPKIPSPFIDNRHDQSIRSVLLKKYGCFSIEDPWMAPYFPIMALRRRNPPPLI
jgi:hypothetical protein